MLSFGESSWLLSHKHTRSIRKRHQRSNEPIQTEIGTEKLRFGVKEREREMETRERDLERLIPMHKSGEVVLSVPPSPLASPIHVAGREVILSLSLYLFTNLMQVCNDWCIVCV